MALYHRGKIVSVMLIVVLILCTSSSCGFQTKYDKSKERYEQNPNIEDLTYLTFTAFENGDLVGLQNYGMKFFLCDDLYADEHYKSAVNYLHNELDYDAKDTAQINLMYDIHIVFFQISLMCFEDGGLKEFSSIIEDFSAVDSKIKSERKQVYQLLDLLRSKGTVPQDCYDLYVSFLQYFLPHTKPDNILDVVMFLQQNAVSKKENQDVIDRYVSMGLYTSSGNGYDKEQADALYASLSNDLTKVSTISKESAKEYILNADSAAHILSAKDFFCVEPIYYEKNGIFCFVMKEYQVVCYGLPTTYIEIVDFNTGEIYANSVNLSLLDG